MERTTYSAFGRVESDYRPARWNGFREPFKFTGKEDDIALGITYFGARYYSPYLGTWVSADPLTIHGLGADLNPYAYVHGRTMSTVDPFGLCDSDASQCPQPSWGWLGTPVPIGAVVGWLTGININFGNGGGNSGTPVNVPRSSGNHSSAWSQSAEDAYNQSVATFGPPGAGNPLTGSIVDATPMVAAGMTPFVMAMAGPAFGAFSVVNEVAGQSAFMDGASAGATGTGAALGADAPLASVLEGHAAGQGFTGVFDTATGEVSLAPSTAETTIPDGWVARAGGHADVSAALGGDAANHAGFAAILEEGGGLRLTWRSGTLNSGPGSLVPVGLRQAIVDAVQAATGRTVVSF